MPLSITVTKRELKNKETGIDMSVPSYDPASSPKLVKGYHVVVITRLPFFKLPEHSEEDIVQFMVPRDYAAFEKFQKDLLDAFPEQKLPDLPRKFHLFMNQSDVDERQVAFDCLLKVISMNKLWCRSVPVLRFLGFELLADRNYFKRRKEYLQKKEEEAQRAKKGDKTVFGGDSEGTDGLFGDVGEEAVTGDRLFQEDSVANGQQGKPFAASSIFDEGESETRVKRSAKISLLDHSEEEELFIPTEAKAGGPGGGGGGLFETEDHSELLNVSETLDDVLQIVSEVGGKSKKTSSTKGVEKPPSKPASHATSGLGLFDSEDNAGGVSDMGTDDIMKYIQQNQAAADEDDLDLF